MERHNQTINWNEIFVQEETMVKAIITTDAEKLLQSIAFEERKDTLLMESPTEEEMVNKLKEENIKEIWVKGNSLPSIVVRNLSLIHDKTIVVIFDAEENENEDWSSRAYVRRYIGDFDMDAAVVTVVTKEGIENVKNRFGSVGKVKIEEAFVI